MLSIYQQLNVLMSDASVVGKYSSQDYVVGERLNHPEGITMIIVTIHCNKVISKQCKSSFNDHMMKSTPMGQRLMYGGIIFQWQEQISFNE